MILNEQQLAGTGIQEYLRKHKHVKSYRLGNYGELPRSA